MDCDCDIAYGNIYRRLLAARSSCRMARVDMEDLRRLVRTHNELYLGAQAVLDEALVLLLMSNYGPDAVSVVYDLVLEALDATHD
jgi:hypothetical protein